VGHDGGYDVADRRSDDAVGHCPRRGSPYLVPATALLFAAGYLLVWCGFSLAATSLQWRLDEAGLLSERTAFGNAILASTVLIAAGVYQWTPMTATCLYVRRARITPTRWCLGFEVMSKTTRLMRTSLMMRVAARPRKSWGKRRYERD
jgi:hypothetical protein